MPSFSLETAALYLRRDEDRQESAENNKRARAARSQARQTPRRPAPKQPKRGPTFPAVKAKQSLTARQDIWAALKALGRPATSKELVEPTGHSLSLINASLRRMERHHHVTATRVNRGRKLLWTPLTAPGGPRQTNTQKCLEALGGKETWTASEVQEVLGCGRTTANSAIFRMIETGHATRVSRSVNGRTAIYAWSKKRGNDDQKI